MTPADLIPRTCSEIAVDDRDRFAVAKPQPLSSYRDVLAYVLLGAPGAGKTIEFEEECRALGDRAQKISARRFARADISSHPEWRDKVLFIDGLDETRAGGSDVTSALDEIQSRLDAFGRPRFRISCRAADWLGSADRRPLAEVSPDGQVTTLRLDPLDRSAVLKHLQSQLDIRDPAAFVQETAASGLDFMLDNPLLLKLLIAAASEADGGPASRREVFERSCRVLASEHNSSHPRLTQPCSPEAALATAGRLCAIQLLASKEGFALSSAHTDVDFVPMADVMSDVTAAAGLGGVNPHEAFITKLYRGEGEQHVVPVHRHVAEYLGASHLADLIGRGVVSARRVCAALTSPLDHKVVTDLRGLSAWVGVQATAARKLLIEADPLGMALYGDISEWPVEDRCALLERLVAQARPEDLWGATWFDSAEHRYRHATGRSFRSLCEPEMSPVIGGVLDADGRNDVPDHVREVLLYALSEADDHWLDELSSLVPPLSHLALDVATPPDVRLAALLAFARIERSSAETAATLRESLDAVRDGTFADPDDRIGGSLLRLLYPEVITPNEIWAYAALMHRGLDGRGWTFWRQVLCDETSAEELASLLDGFAEEAERLWPILSSAFADEMIWKLLTRGVWAIGCETDPWRLYRWIAAVAVTYERHSQVADVHAGLLEWLADNETVTQQLISIWIVRSVDEETGLDEQYFLARLLLGTPRPDFPEWCAQQAHARAADDWEVACAFVEAPMRHRHWLGGTREALAKRVRSGLASDASLLRHLDSFLKPSVRQLEAQAADRRQQQEIDAIQARHEHDRQERQADWSEHLRELIDELRANTFPAQNLHTLAMAYFGRLQVVRKEATPRERIADLIGDDAEILDAVMDALRDAPVRADAPSAQRTAELAADSKHDWLAYPVLAGLAIREAEGVLEGSRLPEELRRGAVAIYATTLLDQHEQPEWPVKWLREDPQLVLDVCHRCAVAALKKGDTYLSTLNWLDGIDGFDDELRDFRLRLLKSISVRLPIAQLPVVDSLVHLVSKHPCTAAFQELVGEKLQSTSMTGAQRVRWLALDAIMCGGEALRALDVFVDANEQHPQHLAAFLGAEFRGGTGLVDRLLGGESIPTCSTLVGVIGRSFSPRQWKSGEVMQIGMAEEMSDLVHSWINELGAQPTAEAGNALDDLVADERLSAWRETAEFARDRQRRLHRDASYEPMGVSEVLDLLHNGSPANVADLHALLCDHLRDLSEYIRGDNSDPWREFWEDERAQSPERPRHEETCRDALLRMLRPRLPDGVDAQPERQYAADRRADISVSFRDFNVPVEIKKNTHPDLWTAIEDQLIANYMTDPGTDGHGIYVVLWFGPAIEGYRHHPSDGDHPQTPDELESRLRESLSYEQRRKISVVVLDLTKP
ncbi:MAG: hypothetical protein OXH86_01685 [Acidimicrobiaceae bacterium]|nr:hypothetical protein [Acidimicrobiaceae bacterium]MDE2895556.1 hypothetical protein [Chloroflexota bacterium]